MTKSDNRNDLIIIKRFIDDMFPLNEGNDKPHKDLIECLDRIHIYIEQLENDFKCIRENCFTVGEIQDVFNGGIEILWKKKRGE